jgi:hypothetical protein
MELTSVRKKKHAGNRVDFRQLISNSFFQSYGWHNAAEPKAGLLGSRCVSGSRRLSGRFSRLASYNHKSDHQTQNENIHYFLHPPLIV